MNEVISAFLNSKQIQIIFNKSTFMNLRSIRTILEQVVLSSIMKLDETSMNKLFDLMIMMVKYQMETVTGPLEIILLTLNHIDAVRDMIVDKTLNIYVDLVHRLILDTYGNMNHKEIWQVRSDCLREVKDYNVRVSILLRLGMQNQDASFNRLTQKYNEQYQQRKGSLENVKLLDYANDEHYIGSLSLFGDRVTLLGKNLYVGSFGHTQSKDFVKNMHQVGTNSNEALKQELEALATQLGKEETISNRPLSLHLFTNDDRNIDSNSDSSEFNNSSITTDISDKTIVNNKSQSSNEYKNSLMNKITSDFSDDDGIIEEPIDIMNLLND